MPALARELERELSRLKSGEHICQIYEAGVERVTAVVAFVKEGLARNQRCMYVAEPHVQRETEAALNTVGIPARAGRRDAVQLLERDAVNPPGVSFSAESMLRYLHQEEDQAISAGFSGLWFAAEMLPSRRNEPKCEDLMKCEVLLNCRSGDCRGTIMCQYAAARIDPTCIHDVLRTHPMAIIGNQVCANPYYEPPDIVRDLSALDDESLSRRVNWWVDQLKRARTTEQDRERLIRQLEAARDELREREEMLQKIFDNVPITLSFFNEQKRLWLVNREWEHTFGWTVKEIEERKLDFLAEFIPDPQEREQAERALKAGTGEWGDYRVRTKNGRAIDICAAAMRLSDGSSIGIAQDVTERVRAAQELDAANQRVLQAEVEQKQFYQEVLRAVTHDKFHLVDATAIPTAGQMMLEVTLDDPGNYAFLRKELREIGAGAGMAPEVAEDFVLAVGEATTNAVKHATHGWCCVYRDADRLLARTSDRGHGIKPEDLPCSILMPGFSTKVSLGMGYTLMLNLADCIWLATGPEGTVVQLAKWIDPEAHANPLLSGALNQL